MNLGCCNLVFGDDFTTLIYFDMIFVPVMVLSVFSCPTGISIFLPEFIWFLFPVFRYLPIFYLAIFITGIALFRNSNNTGINNRTIIEDQISLRNFITEKFKQLNKNGMVL